MPKTNFKTIICFAVLAFCIFFSACGTYREEEDEKLVMLIPCTHQSDISSVVKEANSIVKKKIGIGFELQFIDDNSYDQKLNMKVISKSSDCDVMFIGHLSKYTTAVENYALMPLNALIEKNAPELLDIIPNYLIKDITVNNEIYAIPNEQVVFYQYAYFIQKDLAEKYGWTKTIIESPDELEPFLESVKNGEKTIYPYRTNNGVNMWLLNDYEDIAAGVTIPVNGDYKHAIWKMETPEYMHGVKKLREWYLKGYIRQDVMAVDDDTYDFLDNRYAVYSSRWKPGAEAQIYNKNGKEYISVLIGNSYMKSRSAQDTMLGININSKHKEHAIKLISLLNTDKEFYNLLAFGIEGKHYKTGDDGKITLIPNSGYAPNTAWRFGNQFNALILKDEPDDIWEETRRINMECTKSPIRGMFFVSSPVSVQIARINVVNNEYNEILNGSGDYTVLWNKMIKDYEEVGIRDVLNEVQRQLDEFFKNQDINN